MVTFREATEKDTALSLKFIHELAFYEKMIDEFAVTETMFKDWFFVKKKAEVIFVCEDGKEAGLAVFFYNFSTFDGDAGIYIEDLFVLPEHRHKGYGRALFKKIAEIAVERHCGRVEFMCLNWNKPSVDFYLSLGAKQMNDRTLYRVDGDILTGLAKIF